MRLHIHTHVCTYSYICLMAYGQADNFITERTNEAALVFWAAKSSKQPNVAEAGPQNHWRLLRRFWKMKNDCWSSRIAQFICHTDRKRSPRSEGGATEKVQRRSRGKPKKNVLFAMWQAILQTTTTVRVSMLTIHIIVGALSNSHRHAAQHSRLTTWAYLAAAWTWFRRLWSVNRLWRNWTLSLFEPSAPTLSQYFIMNCS